MYVHVNKHISRFGDKWRVHWLSEVFPPLHGFLRISAGHAHVLSRSVGLVGHTHVSVVKVWENWMSLKRKKLSFFIAERVRAFNILKHIVTLKTRLNHEAFPKFIWPQSSINTFESRVPWNISGDAV